jgi:hypothetical protein
MPEIFHHIHARFVSRSVRDRMPNMPAVGRTLSVFRRVCVVQFASEALVALVVPEVGNGPLNVVVEGSPGDWSALQPGMPVGLQGGRFHLGGLEVSLDRAAVWEPCPDWERLRVFSGTVLGRLEHLTARVRDQSPADSLLALVGGASRAVPGGQSAVHARARRAADAMWMGWSGDEAQLSAGAAQLAGLGGGLTPAGDDLLVGAMLCSWLAHSDPRRFCGTVLEACSQRTTVLSAAFLRSAAAGECNASWHRLLAALACGSDEQLDSAVRGVLSFGHTSGADALAGFLWMGLRCL